MTEHRASCWAVAWVAAASLYVASASAAGVVSRSGARPHVDVESAWIVWDPSSQRQDLIVGAQFTGAVEPFVWVMPVPSPAELYSVDTDLRLALSKLLAGHQRRATGWRMPSREALGPLGSLAFGDQGKVVWEQVKAADADALPRLLGAPMARRHPIIEDWVGRYGRQEWNLVGLRPPAANRQVLTPYVRVRFRAERPFYPYREPSWPADAGPSAGGRVLRITVIAPELMAWKLGPSMPMMGPAWVSFEAPHEDLKGAFGKALYDEMFDATKRYWLTSFEDWHEARPGDDDVTFAKRGDLPVDGAPGTLGDKERRGIALEPMSTPALPEEPKSKAQGVEGREVGTGAAGRNRWGRGGRRLVVFGLLAGLALGAFAWIQRVTSA